MDEQNMSLHDFYYDLPQELIAQDPLEDRSSSRLLVLDRETGNTEHHIFREIINYLNPGDCLVVNNTKVIPARLIGNKVGTDAKIEVLLLKRNADDVWETLVKPGKKAKPGTKISFGDGLLVGEVVDVVEDGNRISWHRCRFHPILPISLRIRIAIRRFMRNTMVLQRRRRPDFILHRSFYRLLRTRVSISPT